MGPEYRRIRPPPQEFNPRGWRMVRGRGGGATAQLGERRRRGWRSRRGTGGDRGGSTCSARPVGPRTRLRPGALSSLARRRPLRPRAGLGTRPPPAEAPPRAPPHGAPPATRRGPRPSARGWGPPTPRPRPPGHPAEAAGGRPRCRAPPTAGLGGAVGLEVPAPPGARRPNTAGLRTDCGVAPCLPRLEGSRALGRLCWWPGQAAGPRAERWPRTELAPGDHRSTRVKALSSPRPPLHAQPAPSPVRFRVPRTSASRVSPSARRGTQAVARGK
ncbi:uncharacterized protein LOC110598738 [Ictidomys tridecemlineatus]